jgi:electron transfer flavoprotein beta subunit
MKILVCISVVPDTTTKIKFIPDHKELDTNGIQWIINPWDELALTRALELKDDPKNDISSVTLAHAGPASSEPVIRKALAIGADDALRVNTQSIDPFSISSQLAEAVRNEKFDIIICGIESSNRNGCAVGGMLAEFLEYPSVTGVSSISIENGEVILTREIDGGKEILSVSTPMVAMVQKGIAKEPRIAAMRGIMMARSKPIKVLEPQKVDSLNEVLGYDMPKPRTACQFIHADDAAQLISLLHSQAKVL